MLKGIFWVLFSAKWHDLPERYSPWKIVYEPIVMTPGFRAPYATNAERAPVWPLLSDSTQTVICRLIPPTTQWLLNDNHIQRMTMALGHVQ